MPRATSPIIVQFEYEQETQNTVRFKEVGDKLAWKVGRLYLQKPTAEALGSPDKLTITIVAL